MTTRAAIFFFVFVVFVSTPIFAQTATPNSRIAWDQTAPDLSTAQGYRYDATIDALPSVTLTAVTCSGLLSPFVCSAAFPAATPGIQHSVTLTATSGIGATAVSSLPSAPLNFTFIVQPASPASVRIAN